MWDPHKGGGTRQYTNRQVSTINHSDIGITQTPWFRFQSHSTMRSVDINKALSAFLSANNTYGQRRNREGITPHQWLVLYPATTTSCHLQKGDTTGI